MSDKKTAARERRRSGQTITRVTPTENADCAWDMVRSHVDRSAHVYADEHLAYDELCGLNPLTRVNHSEAFQQGFGVSTNIIESFFSRVRRSYRGIHHRFSMKYMDWYAAELAWREDRRRVGNRGQTIEMLMRALMHPTSRNLCGYFQGNKPEEFDFVWTGQAAIRQSDARPSPLLCSIRLRFARSDKQIETLFAIALMRGSPSGTPFCRATRIAQS